jgi:hypothetical protein
MSYRRITQRVGLMIVSVTSEGVVWWMMNAFTRHQFSPLMEIPQEMPVDAAAATRLTIAQPSRQLEREPSGLC